ncbi:MAG: hypothetical protein V3U03_11135 [Myxococcota bacterium]
MKFVFTCAGVAAAVLLGGSAWAGSLSSSKVAFTQGDLVGLGAEACATDGPNPGDCIGGGVTDDTGYVSVMTSFIKTPNGKELSFDVALQCALVTFTEAVAKGSGKNGGKATAAAEGRIQVRVAVTPVDGDGEPTGEPVRYALPDNDGDNVLGGPPSDDAGAQGVSYCHRFQELSVAFESLACLSDASQDPDDECLIAVSLLLETLNAHAFNFVLPDVESGPKRIEVQARATADADVFGDPLSSARGEAFVGMGSTRVETVRAVKAWDGSEPPNQSFEDLH